MSLVGLGCDGERGEEAATRNGEASGAGADLHGDLRAERERLLADLARSIRDQRVLDAMRRVPREEFVLPEHRSRSYQDTALPIGQGQSISQPYYVAFMTELLELRGDEKVLEVGTGSGYLTAILGELAGEVWSIEILPELKAAAEARLGDLRARRLLRPESRIHVVLGDGALGYASAAPFDCIIVTAAPKEPPVTLRQQLKAGGRMVIPVGSVVQDLRLVKKGQDGETFEEVTKTMVRFTPMLEGGR
jgi:protein-L-isoaspartate(D-aspartate) O-methyltransferase